MKGKESEFDLIVIGAGYAGLTASLKAVSKGYKTLLVDYNRLGGSCLNVGCIPMKTMLNSSSILRDIEFEEKKGWLKVSKKVDFTKLMKHVHKNIDREILELTNLLKNEKLTFIKGKASFSSKNSIKVGNSEYFAKKILIASGSKPHIPAIKGLERINYKTSDDVFQMNKLPKTITIIGGGYISIEFATVFSDLGSKVNIVEKMPRILMSLDEDVTSFISEKYLGEGIGIYTNSDIVNVEGGKKKSVNFIIDGKKKKIVSDEVFVITGRSPNTFGLELEKAEVEKNEMNGVLVNEKLQTTNPNIFAIGDVNCRSFFVNIAKHEAEMVIENMFEGKNKSIDPEYVPWSVGSRPRIAHVGLNEFKLKEKKIEYGIQKARIVRSGGALVSGHNEGFIKILYNKTNREILGCTIISFLAEENIHEMISLIYKKGTLDDLKEILHIHPSYGEAFEFLK